MLITAVKVPKATREGLRCDYKVHIPKTLTLCTIRIDLGASNVWLWYIVFVLYGVCWLWISCLSYTFMKNTQIMLHDALVLHTLKSCDVEDIVGVDFTIWIHGYTITYLEFIVR